MRQAFTVEPGGTYTLAMFSAGEGRGGSTTRAGHRARPTPPGQVVRLLQASGASGPVKLALNAAGGEPTVLADNASYGLITGYGPQPAEATTR